MSPAGFLRAVVRARGALVVLDLDGTVCAIRRDRDRVRLSPRWRRLLQGLALSPGLRLAFLSGRKLSELRRLTPIAGAERVGDHGNSWQRPALGPALRQRRAWARQAAALKRALGPWVRRLPAAALEPKGFGFCLHLRGLSRRQRERLLPALERRARSASFRVLPAREALDFLPAGAWDKGAALRRLRRTWGAQLPCFYAGDDRTDESAFKALERAPRGLSWKLGAGPSAAKARGSREDLHRFLRLLGRSIRRAAP